ncbi:MAG TPA: DUF4397 domain-containing protein [Gemmatimonadaceae bacterium]|nr:DUF4397 domain-containing protein [Gemmatimonadaceae bacterium]
MNRYQSVAVLLGAALLTSCDLFGGDTGLRDITAPPPSARVKFHNFSPNSVGVDFFANDTKMTAIASSACQNPTTAADSTACTTVGKESTVGTKFGQVASGGLYDAINPGQYTLAAKIAAASDVVSTASQTIADGKYYSFFLSGPYDAATKTAQAFVVEDPIPPGIDYTVGYVRLVDAVSDGADALTLYVTNTETKVESAVGSSVAYKAAGAFEKLAPGTYTLAVRYPGSGSNVISRTSTVSVRGGDVYTVTAYGSTGTSSTLGLDFTENQR